MKKAIKIIVVVLVILLVAGIGAWYYVFVWSANHHRNAEDETGIPVTAVAMVNAYEKNERYADSIYLDKTVQVTGEITEIKINQAGKQTITLKSDDAMSGVLCTLKEKNASLKEGSSITIKGICTGYLSDVIIIEAIVLKDDFLGDSH